MRALASSISRTAIAVALSVSATAAAQNLIATNPEFDGDTTGWEGGSGQTTGLGEDSDGCPDSDSFHAEPTEDGSGTVRAAAVECVTAQPGDVFHLEVRYRSGVPVYLLLAQFANPDCTVSLIAELGEPLPPSAEWTSARVTTTIEEAGIESVRFVILAMDNGASREPYASDFDRAYLGREERIFADDFGGGSPCRWSSSVAGAE